MFKPSRSFLTLFITVMICSLFAQDPKGNTNQGIEDETLLAHFIQARGNNTIVFDSSNVKMFWIDKSVLSRDKSFEILLKEKNTKQFESVPLRIQLINVNETQDCRIDVVADSNDIGFSIIGNKDKALSSSAKEDKFINYNIVSSTFHLEDTQNTTFELVFNSLTEDVLSLRKIVLSFSENKNSLFLASPGVLKINYNSIATSEQAKEEGLSVFSITGKNSKVFSDKRILTSNTPISSSVTIKNIGDKDTRIFTGYSVYTKEGILLKGNNYPYKNNNKVLNVISTFEEGKKILVDSYSDWSKGIYLALNAKEDMSDIPNTSMAGRIIEIKQLDNGQAEILLENAPGVQLKKDDKVRIHGPSGAYLYTTSNSLLRPGEEKVFSSTIQKDDNYLEYSSKALSRGVYYVVPLILSYSTDPNEDNTILISNFTISY